MFKLVDAMGERYGVLPSVIFYGSLQEWSLNFWTFKERPKPKK